MEEVPLRINSDERDFEMDESDFLLQPPDHEIRSSTSRYRSAKRCARCLPLLHCGYVSFFPLDSKGRKNSDGIIVVKMKCEYTLRFLYSKQNHWFYLSGWGGHTNLFYGFVVW